MYSEYLHQMLFSKTNVVHLQNIYFGTKSQKLLSSEIAFKSIKIIRTNDTFKLTRL